MSDRTDQNRWSLNFNQISRQHEVNCAVFSRVFCWKAAIIVELPREWSQSPHGSPCRHWPVLRGICVSIDPETVGNWWTDGRWSSFPGKVYTYREEDWGCREHWHDTNKRAEIVTIKSPCPPHSQYDMETPVQQHHNHNVICQRRSRHPKQLADCFALLCFCSPAGTCVWTYGSDIHITLLI